MNCSTRLFCLAAALGFVAGCDRPPGSAETSLLYGQGYKQSDVQAISPSAQRLEGEWEYTRLPVESFRWVRLNEIRAEILAAQKAGVAWAKHPMQIVEHFWPVGDEWRSCSLRMDSNELGSGTEMTITVMLYGLGDHLVAAEWDQFKFGRNDIAAPWQIHEWRKSHLSGANPRAWTASNNP
jgi:hypothetical protein